MRKKRGNIIKKLYKCGARSSLLPVMSANVCRFWKRMQTFLRETIIENNRKKRGTLQRSCGLG